MVIMSYDARTGFPNWLRLWIRTTAVAFFFSAILVSPAAGEAAEADPQGQIERFDVRKGQVTARIPVTAEMQQELSRLAQSASGSAGTFRIDPDDGTVLHIPLRPALEIRQPGFYALASEAYLFLPKGREPYILFFSEENEPRLFGLKHPVNRLLALCGWEDAYAPAGQ
jgi:hypothetical protein